MSQELKKTVAPKQNKVGSKPLHAEVVPKVLYPNDSTNTLDANQQKVFDDASLHLKKSAELENSDKNAAKSECDKASDAANALHPSLSTFQPATCVAIYSLEIAALERYIRLKESQEKPSEKQVAQYWVVTAVNYRAIAQLYYDRSAAYRHMGQDKLSAADDASYREWQNKFELREAKSKNPAFTYDSNIHVN